MKTLAFLPSTREAASSAGSFSSSLNAPGLTVLLARSGEAKARILSSLQQGLSPAMRPQSWSTPVPRGEAFIVHAQDLGAMAGSPGSELPGRLAAVGSAERSARMAIAALRTRASGLLGDGDGGGRIAELNERLSDLDGRLEAALEEEQAERTRIEPLLDAASALADLERQRHRNEIERERCRALLRLWPDWQQLQQLRADAERLARFERVQADAEERHARVIERSEKAEKALRSCRREVGELINERSELKSNEPDLPPGSDEVVRLCAGLTTYRARLLQLAATRARIAELESTLSTGLRRLGRSWDVERLHEIDLLRGRRDELHRWQARSAHVHAIHADAKHALEGARGRLRDQCRQVSEHLARPPAEDEDSLDLRWRALWTLRSHLEEIWDVQSRAEANSRTLTDREETLRGVDAKRYRTVPRWLLAALTLLVALSAAMLGSGAWHDYVPGFAVAALTTVLVLIRVALHMRARWITQLEERRGARREKLQLDIEGMRRRRDAAWTRAAKLDHRIRAAATRLGLSEPVTPDAVDACERELADELRRSGARTALTELLRDVYETESDEQALTAQLDDADTERRTLRREWQEWSTEVGLPPDIELERSAEWIGDLERVVEARSGSETARAELAEIEPVTAAWETEARELLRRSGADTRPELCGSVLEGALTALEARLRRETQRKARRAVLDTALQQAEERLVAAEAELKSARRARQELFDSNGVGDDAGLRAQLEGWRHWRDARDQVTRVEATIDTALSGFGADTRADLASGDQDRWQSELRRCETQIERTAERLAESAQQRHTAERCLDAARAAMQVAELRLEREEVLAELGDAAREWKLCVLAAALLETSSHEHKRSARRELLQAASRTLATLTRGRYTGIDRGEQPTDLALVDRDGRRVPVGTELGAGLLGQVNLSLLLGRAAQLASRGASVPFVLDDVLGPLPLDDAHLVAQELATLARAHPVLYLTTAARRGDILSALPSNVAVFDVE